MAKENSFDIVSKTDYAEVTNALNQTVKEVRLALTSKAASDRRARRQRFADER
jgi:uncharacterized protein YajQ (UPF0234 family)